MQSTGFNFIGIDYGSKLAGTTAIAVCEDSNLCLYQSAKNVDADTWLTEFIRSRQISKLYLDAPLSLPSALLGRGGDYFYREADRQCKAMSPMFLGGLTARAIKLKDSLSAIEFYEAYPAGLVRELPLLKDVYQKKKSLSDDAIDLLKRLLPIEVKEDPGNWHQYDALLCWLTGYRHSKSEAREYGDPSEGVILT